VQELGGSTDRQIAQLVNGNIPYHRRYAQFMNGGWAGSRKHSALIREFESSLVREFEVFREFGLFQEFCENSQKSLSSGFRNLCSGTDCESVIGW